LKRLRLEKQGGVEAAYGVGKKTHVHQSLVNMSQKDTHHTVNLPSVAAQPQTNFNSINSTQQLHDYIDEATTASQIQLMP
jgi:hypothetical protein